MRDKTAPGSMPLPAHFMNAQSAMVGLRGRDLFSTLRTLAFQGLRQPVHSTRHLLAFGKQLGRVMLGDTPHQPNPQDSRFADPTWQLNPFYRRSLQAYLAWHKQLKAWIDESDLSPDDRTRAHFLFSLLNDALAPSNTLLNPLAVKELFNSGGSSVLRGARQLFDDLLHNSGMPQQVDKRAFEVGRNLAVTPGAVVYRCEMFELLHYKPMSEKQYERPLLMVPPSRATAVWIRPPPSSASAANRARSSSSRKASVRARGVPATKVALA